MADLVKLFPVLGINDDLILERTSIDVLRDLKSRLKPEFAKEYSNDLQEMASNTVVPDRLPITHFTADCVQMVHSSGPSLVPSENDVPTGTITLFIKNN